MYSFDFPFPFTYLGRAHSVQHHRCLKPPNPLQDALDMAPLQPPLLLNRHELVLAPSARAEERARRLFAQRRRLENLFTQNKALFLVTWSLALTKRFFNRRIGNKSSYSKITRINKKELNNFISCTDYILSNIWS